MHAREDEIDCCPAQGEDGIDAMPCTSRVVTLFLCMQHGVMMCSDGWRKRACGGGQPLINVLFLTRDQGSFFWKVGKNLLL
jgi:hypothetical protein